MRNIFQFIYRFHVGLIFIALETLCFYLLFQHNNFQKSIYVNASKGVIGTLYDRRDELSNYLRLKAISDTLATQNARLKNQLPDSYISLNNDLALLDDSLMRQKYEYKSARVVNTSINRQSNYITINAGEKHGINQEMGVVANNAAIGVVRYVSDHFAVVMPIINSSFLLSVKLERSNEFGQLKWDGVSPYSAIVTDLPKHANASVGEKILTTGYSTYFPENVEVGQITDIVSKSGADFITVRIDLATKFDQLNYVDVIANLLKEEQIKLEEEAESQSE